MKPVAIPPLFSKWGPGWAAIPLVVAIVLFIVFEVVAETWHFGALVLLGFFAGFVMRQSCFGFSDNFRQFLLRGRGSGVRAHFVMIFLTSIAFGALTDEHDHLLLKEAPLGLHTVFGACMFGIGMQLADCCASGTLIDMGSVIDSPLPLITMFAFMNGAVLGAWRKPYWYTFASTNIDEDLLQRKPGLVTAYTGVKWQEGVVFNLYICGGLYALSWIIELLIYGRENVRYERWPPQRVPQRKSIIEKILFGRWPWFVGVPLIIFVAIMFLVFAKKPWGIASAFMVWGTKLYYQLGGEVDEWLFFTSSSANMYTLKEKKIYDDQVSVHNMGLILGAIASSLLTRFITKIPQEQARQGQGKSLAGYFKVDLYQLIGAVVGGFMMGYGAIVASGCNIGGYYSGTASFQWFGWVWFVSAMMGVAIGIFFRPFVNRCNEAMYIIKGGRLIPWNYPWAKGKKESQEDQSVYPNADADADIIEMKKIGNEMTVPVEESEESEKAPEGSSV